MLITIFVHFIASYIRIMERQTSCDMWSSINLTCETTTTIASALKHIWVQTYNDVTIEERVGHIEGNISVLTIPFCVYQDAGNYSCKWYSKTDEYIAIATVHVRSTYFFNHSVRQHMKIENDNVAALN